MMSHDSTCNCSRRTALTSLLALAASTLVSGCKSGGKVKEPDPTIRQQAESGEEAYAEGYVDQAVTRYRLALKRAWALDDPIEAGNASYNLAACLVSMGKLPLARAWVRESRLEFARGRFPDTNTWLLEGKIAQQQGQLDEAYQLIAEAERIVQCNDPKPQRCPCEPKGCDCECVEWYQFRKYREQKKVLERKASTVQAEVYLIRASLALDQGDIATAQGNISCACELLPEVCDPNLGAELQHLRARIHLLQGRPDLAAAHFDTEAELLRHTGNFREIVNVVGQAAQAYEQAGLLAAAADRWYRVARILYARDDLAASQERLTYGLKLAELSNDPVVQDRYALLFAELDSAIEATKKKSSASDEKATKPPATSETVPLPPVGPAKPEEKPPQLNK